MRIAELLATLSDQDLDRLAIEHVPTDERPSRPQLCIFLENSIRSFRFVNAFVFNRQPPTFSILTTILESPGYRVPDSGFKERVLGESQKIAGLVDGAEILSRQDQLRLYRKSLYEARRDDLDLNSSEANLLSVLRREVGIAQVEHFLIEHHQDLREFWDKPDCFEHEMHALRSAGLIFSSQQHFMIPEDVAPAIWQTLGIDMSTESARRLFAFLSNTELAESLEAAGSRTSGSKEEKLERLILERVQPRFVLPYVGIFTLKDICRETDASVSGNKEELIERIVSHFALGKDQVVEETAEVPVIEERRSSEEQFATLFNALQHQDLNDILRRRPDLRQSGTKDVKIKTLWEAHLSERTLLGELMNRQLEDILHKLGLRLSGSKDVRIERLIDHFAGAQSTNSASSSGTHPRISILQPAPMDPLIGKNQELFAQKATNPQASLQPWLEEVLSAQSKIRCYATEDENPTKQLKNKLSQAIAAKDGVLVLLLAGEAAYAKAKEALLERWMTNDEWPKSVAAVALAFPTEKPAVQAIIDRVKNPFSGLLQSKIFPQAEIFHTGERGHSELSASEMLRCAACGAESQASARFCASCGSKLGVRE